MKCRFCGAKIGILERWRFGDFCSKEHKDEFAVDLVKLNEQIVQDLRRIPSRYKTDNKEEATTTTAPEQAVEQPDPPEAIFMLEADPDPLMEPPAAKSSDEIPAPRSKSEQWRLFSKMADWEGLPPSAAIASKEKEKSDTFLWVQMDEENVQGPQGVLLAGAFPAILPRRVLQRIQGHMPVSPVWVPPNPRQRAAEDARRYAVGGSIHQFVQNHAWGWMADSVSGAMPGLDPVLSAYPLTAPWTNWTIVAPSQPMMPPRPQQAMPMAGPSMVPPPMGPTATPAPGPAMSAGPMSPAPPTAGMPAPAPGGMVMPPPPMVSAPGGAPSVYQAPQVGAPPLSVAPSYGAMPSGAVPVWPSTGPLASAGPAMASPGSVMAPQGIAYPTQRLMSPGITWRELPPPLFSALVDLGDLMEPESLPFVQRIPGYQSIRPELVIAGQLPALAAAPECGMPFVDCQGDPAEDLAPFAPRPHRPRSHARTLWRRHLVLPKAYGEIGQTRVPVKPGPAFLFSIRQSRPAPQARPQLQIGRWHA